MDIDYYFKKTNYDKILTLDKQNFIKYFISKLLLKNNYYVTINYLKLIKLSVEIITLIKI